jgi:hypothetical protein
MFPTREHTHINSPTAVVATVHIFQRSAITHGSVDLLIDLDAILGMKSSNLGKILPSELLAIFGIAVLVAVNLEGEA